MPLILLQKWILNFVTNGQPGSVPLLQYYTTYLGAKTAGDAVLNNPIYTNISYYSVIEVYTQY